MRPTLSDFRERERVCVCVRVRRNGEPGGEVAAEPGGGDRSPARGSVGRARASTQSLREAQLLLPRPPRLFLPSRAVVRRFSSSPPPFFFLHFSSLLTLGSLVTISLA